MKLYCFYTPSHTALFEDWFGPSVLPEYDLHPLKYHKQLCPSATFRQNGWRETQQRKLEYWMQAIEENMGDMIACSDVDAQFFGQTVAVLTSLLQNKDVLFQLNTPNRNEGLLCSGFLACQCNKVTHAFFRCILDGLRKETYIGEQSGINALLGGLPHSKQPHTLYDSTVHGKTDITGTPLSIRWGTIPGHLFWSPMYAYSRLEEVYIPSSTILFHHATWTHGVDNKIAQLQCVQQAVDQTRTCATRGLFRKTWTVHRDRVRFMKYMQSLEQDRLPHTANKRRNDTPILK